MPDWRFESLLKNLIYIYYQLELNLKENIFLQFKSGIVYKNSCAINHCVGGCHTFEIRLKGSIYFFNLIPFTNILNKFLFMNK